MAIEFEVTMTSRYSLAVTHKGLIHRDATEDDLRSAGFVRESERVIAYQKERNQAVTERDAALARIQALVQNQEALEELLKSERESKNLLLNDPIRKERDELRAKLDDAGYKLKAQEHASDALTEKLTAAERRAAYAEKRLNDERLSYWKVVGIDGTDPETHDWNRVREHAILSVLASKEQRKRAEAAERERDAKTCPTCDKLAELAQKITEERSGPRCMPGDLEPNSAVFRPKA